MNVIKVILYALLDALIINPQVCFGNNNFIFSPKKQRRRTNNSSTVHTPTPYPPHIQHTYPYSMAKALWFSLTFHFQEGIHKSCGHDILPSFGNTDTCFFSFTVSRKLICSSKLDLIKIGLNLIIFVCWKCISKRQRSTAARARVFLNPGCTSKVSKGCHKYQW